MKFTWDGGKSERNFLARGFGFDFAALIFSGSVLESPDARKDYGELRFRAIGEADGFVLVVIYTDRGDVRRIISARLANRKERALWHSFVKH